jgi:tetratricopeptide (TPR) repeat protein
LVIGMKSFALMAILLVAEPKTLVEEGRALAEKGQHAAAIERFNTAIAADAKLAEAHAGLAASHLSLGRVDEAEASANRAVELQPKEPGYRMILGRVFVRRDQYDKAKAAYVAAAEASPAKAGVVYFDFGSVLTGRKGDEPSALIDWSLRQAANATPPHLDAMFTLGQTYAAVGKDEGAAWLSRYIEEQDKLPEDKRDKRKLRLARQMIRALELAK